MSEIDTNVVPIKRGVGKKQLIGSTIPRIHTPLLKGATKSEEVAQLAEKIGLPLIPWQRWVLDDLLSTDENDMWRKKTALILVARQNGKTHLARMLILSHLYLWGSKNVLGMSSNRNMALDTFRQVAYTIEDNPFLKAQVRQIRLANGQESITLLNGARYEIAAATRDAPRGKSVDGLLYIDELREWTEEAYTAALPVTRAGPNAMTLMTSNAGDGFSSVLNDLVERCKSYPPANLGYYEYSAPQHCKITDRKAWAMANPALGHLITEETLEESVNTNSVEATRTEMLCQWIDSAVSPWVYGSIEACSDSTLEIPIGPATIMAFDIAPTRRSGALVAGQIKDGKIAVGLMQLWSSEVAIDEVKMASDINDWAKKYRPTVICFDKYATQTLATKLEQSGWRIQDVSGQAFYQACSDLSDSLANSRIVHSGQTDLVQHLNNCAAKTNDTGWRIIRRKSSGPVVAAISLAMVVSELTKPQRTAAIFA
jgi:phage terminase large subunit-like protein